MGWGAINATIASLSQTLKNTVISRCFLLLEYCTIEVVGVKGCCLMTVFDGLQIYEFCAVIFAFAVVLCF